MSTTAVLGLQSRRRRLAAVMALVLAVVSALGISSLFTQSKSEAHGATVFPGSRQYFCYFDALTADGALDPYNEACQAAFDEVGDTPFYNWFGNLDSNGAGQTVGYIPDGEICNGGGNGPYDFSPLNNPGAWPQTHVTAGATVEWRYNNWAHHPGKFDLYITKEGWNPDEPIAWDDLELFETVQDPPQTGGSGSNENYYYADVTLPEREGYHVVFTHWVRSDSTENFYACSDVVFDGGNGEITGINPDAQLPGNDGGSSEPSDPAEGEMPAEDSSATCEATATVNPGADTTAVEVEVANTGDSDMSNWMIHWLWEPDSGIEITNWGNTEITTQGDMVMAAAESWNRTVPTGGTATFGFTASGDLTEMPALECIPTA